MLLFPKYVFLYFFFTSTFMIILQIRGLCGQTFTYWLINIRVQRLTKHAW